MILIMRKTRTCCNSIAYLILGIFLCIFLCIFVVISFKKNLNPVDLEQSKQCYKRSFANNARSYDEYSINYLVDVMDAADKPSPESIIFHQTSCTESGLVQLNSRQACAIESTAKLNPNRNIFVLFASPVGLRESFSSLPTNIEILKTYSNVHLRNNDVWKYAKGTPLEKWLSTDTLFESKYLFEHMSDVLRFLTLYKFGGIFMDLDIVAQKNFDDLGHNFAGDDSVDAVGCGVMHFNNDQLGRKIAELCISFLERHFDGKAFIANGPLIITRALEKICRATDRHLMTPERCEGFRVYPKSTFYAVSWTDWRYFFEPEMTDHTLVLVENSTVIHVWNDVSKNVGVKIGHNTAYEIAAKNNCPKVYYSRVNYEYF